MYSGAGVDKTKNTEGLWVHGAKVVLKTEAPLLILGRSVEWFCSINKVTKREIYIIYKTLKLSPNAKEQLRYCRTKASSMVCLQVKELTFHAVLLFSSACSLNMSLTLEMVDAHSLVDQWVWDLGECSRLQFILLSLPTGAAHPSSTGEPNWEITQQ